MKRIQLTILSVAFLLLLGCGDSSKQANSSTQVDSLASQIDELAKKYQKLDIFSGVVLVAENGNPIYHKAFGLADRESEMQNTINTLFDIGSMNKTFTSIVIKQLIDEGKLNYDSKLTQYVNGFEDPNTQGITVEHLLNHESGFGDYHDPDYFDAPRSEKTLSAIVDRAKEMELMFPPGEESEYSNTGYVLLGAVIEEVTGKSYFENVKDRIIKPLDLKNTYVENLEKFDENRASGYLYSPLGALEKNENKQDLPNPDGGFLSTVEDVMKFYRSYYYDEILLNEDIKAEDPYFKSISNLPPGKAPLSAGGFEGFNTAMFQVLSDDRTIIVFANMDEPVAEQLALGILRITRGQEPESPKLPAIQNVRVAYEEKGVQYVVDNFEELTTNYHPDDPKDWILNDLGYAYLFAKEDTEGAIDLFKINTMVFPDLANTWDSLGEAYLKKGDKKEALKHYRKALEINPSLPSAKEKVKELDV